jgi:tetratricopeptide (TPR) repeat protein
MRLRIVARILAAGLLLSLATCGLILRSSAQQARTPGSQRGVEPVGEPRPEGVALRPGPYYALVIGIDKYQNQNGLKTAVADATAIDKILRDTYGFHTDLLLNADATRDRIKAKLFEYRTKLGKDANLLIYYAGHGVNDAGAGKAYWLPVEAGEDNSHWIQSDEITADLKAIPAQHILVISDSCYSGNMREVYPSSSRQIAKRMNGISRELVSSGQDQPVSDEGSGGHSAFAGPLLKALENESESSFSARSLFERIQGAVMGNSDQTPNYARLRDSGDDGFAEFFFFRRGLMMDGSALDPDLTDGLRPVAVLGFKNLGTPESGSLSVTISEILSSEIAAGGNLRTISTEEVSRAKSELALPDTDTYANDTLTRIRKRLGADAVFVGSYRVVGVTQNEMVELHLCAQYTTTGHLVCATQKNGASVYLGELVDKAGRELLEKLGLPILEPALEAKVLASYPSNPEAMQNYSEGLAKLRVFDYVRARDLFNKALEAAPDIALFHSALAEAWSNLGYDDKAKEQAHRALDLSHALPREQELLLEGRYHELNSDWSRAIQTYTSLWTFTDNPEYGLRLAIAQISAGKGQDALATLGKLSASSGDDPRIDIEAAAAARSLSDFTQESERDEQAIKVAKAINAPFLEAQGMMDKCWALYKLGELEKAKEFCEGAQSTFGYVGDKKDFARTATRLADILNDQGNLEAALRYHEEALQNMKEIGSQRDVAGALANIAGLMMIRGDLDGAQKYYEDALSISRDVNDKNHVLQYENNLATIFSSKGDFEQTKRVYEEVVTSAEGINDKYGEAVALSNLGSVLYLLGELQEAQKKIQTGLDILRALGTKSAIASSLEMLGDVQLAECDLADAEADYKESRRIFEEMGQKGLLAYSLISLAGLELEKESPSEAEALARLGNKEFEAEEQIDGDASGHEMLVRALIAEKKFAEAVSVMKEVKESKVQDVTIRLSLKITDARLTAETGNKNEALRKLEVAISDAKSMKLSGYELDARLAKAEIEVRQSGYQRAASDVKDVEDQAKAKGYLLVGRKAAKLRS